MNPQKVIYSILKEIEQGNEPKREDYEIELEQWGEIAELILEEELAKNIQIQRAGIGNKVFLVWYSSVKITLSGLKYLEENSGFAKTYKGIKEVRDWFKL